MKSLRNNKIAIRYVIALGMLLLAVTLGVFLGATRLNPWEALSAIARGETDGADAGILIYVRFPRVLAGVVCGAALSVSGAVIQGVLANRLASPSIIGVNSGALLAVTVCSAFGLIGGWQLPFFSFLGAFFAVMVVGIGAKKWGASRGTMILMGVALNAFLGAISDSVTVLFPEVSVMRSDFKIGDFSAVSYTRVIPAAVLIVVGILVLLTLSNELDLLTLGEESAKGLGLNTDWMRVVFLLLGALLAGAAVSVCGLLSFVGLLIPHAVRRTATSDSGHLIPLCALFGAGFTTLCDTFARVILAPYELPVGIIMAFLGAPFFVFVLIKGKGGSHA